MNTFTSIFNVLSSLGALFFIGLSITLIVARVQKKENAVSRFVQARTLLVVCVTSFLAMLGSLIYSNVIGFTPCDLCWFQRIFMYPLFFITLYALVKKDGGWMPYAKLLTLIGGVIALFHSFIYYTNVNPFPCSATASCTARYVWEFGFVTIPLMALSMFVFIYLSLIASQKKDTATVVQH